MPLSSSRSSGFPLARCRGSAAGHRGTRPVALDYELRVPTQRQTVQYLSKLGSLLASTSWPLAMCRPDRDREQTIHLRSFLLNAELTDEGVLRARLKVCPDGSARPEELLECLGLRDLLDQGAVLGGADPCGAGHR